MGVARWANVLLFTAKASIISAFPSLPPEDGKRHLSIQLTIAPKTGFLWEILETQKGSVLTTTWLVRDVILHKEVLQLLIYHTTR